MPEETSNKSGTVKKKERIRLFDIFFSGDWRTALLTTVDEVVIPNLMDLFVDMGNAFLKAWVYGDKAPKKEQNLIVNRVPYNDPSSIKGNIATRRVDRFNFAELVFNDKAFATDVLVDLKTDLASYQIATVFDLYDHAGVDTKPTDRNYGWTNLDTAYVDKVRGGWIIRLPKPLPIEKSN